MFQQIMQMGFKHNMLSDYQKPKSSFRLWLLNTSNAIQFSCAVCRITSCREQFGNGRLKLQQRRLPSCFLDDISFTFLRIWMKLGQTICASVKFDGWWNLCKSKLWYCSLIGRWFLDDNSCNIDRISILYTVYLLPKFRCMAKSVNN